MAVTVGQATQIYDGKAKGLVLGDYVLLDEIKYGRVPLGAWLFGGMHMDVVLDAIDAGSVGWAFKACHRALQRIVALKVLPPKAMRSPESVEYVIQAANGLEYAHQRGVIHGDVTPGNLLLDREVTIKILYMGLAGMFEPEEASSDLSSGTDRAMYTAPEQAEDTRRLDHGADIYSLGGTLYFLLAGRAPYTGATAAEMLWALRNAPIPPLRTARPDVPARVDAVCRRMMAKRPEDRCQSMGEVIAELEPCVRAAGLPSASPPSEAPQKLLGRKRRENGPIIAGAMSEKIEERPSWEAEPVTPPARADFACADMPDEEFDTALPSEAAAPPAELPESAESVVSLDEGAPNPLDENVQFSVYRPNVVRPETWCLLLAFAHLAERRPDAAEDEPDPIKEVQRQARLVPLRRIARQPTARTRRPCRRWSPHCAGAARGRSLDARSPSSWRLSRRCLCSCTGRFDLRQAGEKGRLPASWVPLLACPAVILGRIRTALLDEPAVVPPFSAGC